MHIRQKTTGQYVVVVASGDLLNHPAVVEHPELFEVVEGDAPDGCQFLMYAPSEVDGG